MRARIFTIKVLSIVLAGWYISLICPAAAAQSLQFWGEADAYVSFGKTTRLWLQATRKREDGSPIGTEIGPSLEFHLKPLLRLRSVTSSQVDRARSRLLTLSFGYRYLTSHGPSENQVLLEASPRFPLPWELIMTNRNRAELRIITGKFSWRYRNRLTLERGVHAGSYAFWPFVRGEGGYDSNYEKWNATVLGAGVRFPVKKHIEVEPSYQHLNDSGCTPNRQVNLLGLKLNLYF
jgi:hypothetical protein